MTAKEYLEREQEIQLAVKEFPTLEIGAAYSAWKAKFGEEATFLQTGNKDLTKAKAYVRQSAWKPCEKCQGKAMLESVCGGCVEGRKGYKSKFVCEACLHRELSIEPFDKQLLECLNRYGV